MVINFDYTYGCINHIEEEVSNFHAFVIKKKIEL